MELLKDYPYLYETHLHCKESSACAVSTAVEMVRAAKKTGYSGIFLTNHNWNGNTCVDRSLPWTEWVHEFCKPYHLAKEEGDRIGLQVFYGYEAGHDATEFLIYGVDEEWLCSHPEIKDATVMEQYKLIHDAGGMVIHAHPFREEYYIPEIRLFPEYVDGVEAMNATHSSHLSKSHNQPVFDERAIAYAKEHHFPMTAGSDVHSTQMFGGGVAFKTPITSVKDYQNRILSKEGYVLSDGEYWYDSGAKRIAPLIGIDE